MSKTMRGVGFAVVVAGAALFVAAGTALAHIDPDPPAVQAGTAATVGFHVEHGCAGSPTVSLEFKVPDGVTDAKPVDKSGWTGSATADTVTFADGSLAADQPDTFSISFTAPETAGTIYFPVVQTCETGSTAWIEIAAAGAAEPEHPAPAIKVTDGPPTSADLAPAEDDQMTESSGAEAPTATTAAPSSSDDSSNTGVVVGVIIGAVVVIGGGAWFVANKRRNSSNTKPA